MILGPNEILNFVSYTEVPVIIFYVFVKQFISQILLLGEDVLMSIMGC